MAKYPEGFRAPEVLAKGLDLAVVYLPPGFKVGPGGFKVGPGGFKVRPAGFKVGPGGFKVWPGGFKVGPGGWLKASWILLPKKMVVVSWPVFFCIFERM